MEQASGQPEPPPAPIGEKGSSDAPDRPSIPAYALFGSIGEGSYGRVRLGRHRVTGQWRAIKLIRGGRNGLPSGREFEREFRGLRS